MNPNIKPANTLTINNLPLPIHTGDIHHHWIKTA